VRFLVDTSALLRIWRKQVDPGWYDISDRGLIAICEPVLAETLMAADAKRYAAIEEEFRDTYVWAMVPDNIWDLVAAVRRDLVPHSAHKGLSVADLVVAATAIRLKLEVLHEDGDFETVARFVPELRQRRISAGPD
jgi:predicted nucleic acid-binding protein